MPEFKESQGFTMRGSEFYGKGNQSPAPGKYTSPAKDRETWSSAAHREEAAEHNAQPATSSHYGAPHGPKPPEMKEGTDISSAKPITDDEGNVIED